VAAAAALSSRFPYPESNIVTVGSNDFKLNSHASRNDSSAVHKNRNSTLFHFLIIPIIFIYGAFIVRNFVSISSNDFKLGIHVSGKIRSAVQKNRNSTLLRFLNFPLWFL